MSLAERWTSVGDQRASADARRHRDAARRLGSDIRQMREDAGLRQAAVARSRGRRPGRTSRDRGGRCRAEPRGPRCGSGWRSGRTSACGTSPNTGPRIRDHLQVAMSEALLRALHPRWRATPEVPVYRPVHGVIDLVLEERDGTTTVATELHSQVRRVEQQVRWQMQKADALALQPDQAGAVGQPPARAPEHAGDARRGPRRRRHTSPPRTRRGPSTRWRRSVTGRHGRAPRSPGCASTAAARVLLDGPPRGVAVGR